MWLYINVFEKDLCFKLCVVFEFRCVQLMLFFICLTVPKWKSFEMLSVLFKLRMSIQFVTSGLPEFFKMMFIHQVLFFILWFIVNAVWSLHSAHIESAGVEYLLRQQEEVLVNSSMYLTAKKGHAATPDKMFDLVSLWWMEWVSKP